MSIYFKSFESVGFDIRQSRTVYTMQKTLSSEITTKSFHLTVYTMQKTLSSEMTW